MANTRELQTLRTLLQRRRSEVQEAISATREELRLHKAQERDPEYEEGAQNALADYTLSHLIETQRRELILIDAAMERMDDGTYGTCVDCEDEIPVERLMALPFALRCEEDARRKEREFLPAGAEAHPSM